MMHKILPDFGREYYVYIMASKSGTLYVGSTNNIISRMYEHKNGILDGFTKKYKCNRFVYFEMIKTKQESRNRELQLKKYNHKKKEELIKIINPLWNDLSDGWYDSIDVILPLINRQGIPRRSSSGF